MKTINLYFKFQFTSKSSDSQPISLGIVSDEILDLDPEELQDSYVNISKSFYAEFTDFDINRCDDWVKENVVGKLKYYGTQDEMFLGSSVDEGTYLGSRIASEIKDALYRWLKQFSDYQIQFICDCGTWDWYWMVNLLDKRIIFDSFWLVPDVCIPDDMTGKEFLDELRKSGPGVIYKKSDVKPELISIHHKGNPILPENISPVPFDLNDLIAIKKGVTPKEAFLLDREFIFMNRNVFLQQDFYKHNSLSGAKVIKEIYNKLI